MGKRKQETKAAIVDKLIQQSLGDVGTVNFKTGLTHFAELLRAFIDYVESEKKEIKKILRR